MNCKNCNNTLKASQKFCDECGAKIIQNRLKPKVIAHQINEQFISIDNKFFRTFIDLFRQPETVIVGYINGTRKKYIDVLQYFAISLTFAGLQVFLISTFFKDAIDADMLVLENLLGSISQDENTPFKTMDFDGINKYQTLIYIIGIPFSTTSTWLAYFIAGKRQYNFTEHLVLNLYYNAQIIIITVIISILLLVFGINYFIVSGIITVLIFAYLFYTLRRIFKTTFWYSVLYFLLIGASYVIITTVLSIISVIIVLSIALLIK
ncbi:hypothetical protein ADIWIN_2429 [Winogradskyella psychrotolerans RS-3]|uniref:DUF3667 domain-containing protein n=1 Tax=Winogradskyella psychrotolerans RS-3 TaxID=641526 RepID=S7X0I9_9FLAO|nr:DUF3667 domain-containing protein [Winogradskyella psychrotolerans]EPR72539.1 hypothetical protein ADIWIN_2429 [Winogradskyella psychrotolerans RS-3]